MTPGKAAIIYHAGAGRGQASDLVAPTCRRLEASGWRVVASRQTRAVDHAARELVPHLAERCDLIVVIAGDGTLREVCAGLCRIDKSLPIGFVPTGNANVIARDQTIPLAPEPAIALLTQGRVRSLDVGILRSNPANRTGAVFLAMVEIGFGARVVHLTQRLRYGRLKTLYRRWGDPVYLAAALGALFSPMENPFCLYRESDPRPTWQRAAIIANTRCYAKGWAMAPDARMDDGRLDIVTRQRSGPVIFFKSFRAAQAARRPPAAFSRYTQGRQFRCISKPPMTVQMDGDPLPPLRWLDIGIAPGRLRLIVPS